MLGGWEDILEGSPLLGPILAYSWYTNTEHNRRQDNDGLIDFNGMSTPLSLFYAKRLV